MKAFLKTKAGVVLVGFSVLAVWALLAAHHVQAHTTALPTPTCSNLPTAEGFYTAAETAAIASNALTPSATPKEGTGLAANGGYENLRYAKITVPDLAAGELRVFDTRASGVSDAILCRPGTDVTSRTSYSAHDAAERAAVAADTAANNATITESSAKSALRSAASALDSAARSLTAAGNTNDAATATSNANAARTIANADADQNASDEVGALQTAVTNLRAARDAFHARFQIQTEVNPGDEEYVLVIATDDTPTWRLQFHGAIVTNTATATQMQRQRTLNAGDQHTFPITVTAPGLLTVETTGSTDTSGMLGEGVTAMDDNSGSEDNFKIVAPVPGAADGSVTYTVTVDGQTTSTTGTYTLDMDFEVAMQTGLTADTGFTVPDAPIWTDTSITADDTTVQIQPSTDEDYFLLTIAADSSGFLTIEAMDDTTSAADAATTGTFYGPTGELATDTNSGADSSHFRIRAPVEEEVSYLVKVTGTTGVYQLSAMLDRAEGTDLLTVPGAQNAPTGNDVGCGTNNDADSPGEICPPGSGESLRIERYVFEVTESGALDVRTTGNIDTVGTLYGPSGNQIATDDNSGTNNNFRISVSVGPGLHLVEVRGKERTTQGVFNLIVNFVPGAEPIDPTDPVDPVDPGPPTVRTDSTGELEDPPNGGTRSGIGLIRGWVCGAARVEVRITGPSGPNSRNYTIPVLYGSDRGDVADLDVCDSRGDDFGFAAQFNYSELPAGTYTAQAFADGEQIGQVDNGQTNTFEVIRLSDTDSFLEGLSSDVTVRDFPGRGDTTVLEWDQASQNFQIKAKTP